MVNFQLGWTISGAGILLLLGEYEKLVYFSIGALLGLCLLLAAEAYSK